MLEPTEEGHLTGGREGWLCPTKPEESGGAPGWTWRPFRSQGDWARVVFRMSKKDLRVSLRCFMLGFYFLPF